MTFQTHWLYSANGGMIVIDVGWRGCDRFL